MLHERVKNTIEYYYSLLSEIESKDAWYRNSTAGRELKRRYAYVIEVLEGLLTEDK